MKHTLLLAATLAVASAAMPTPVRAACNISKVIDQCDALFPPDVGWVTPMRGWCYLAGIAACGA